MKFKLLKEEKQMTLGKYSLYSGFPALYVYLIIECYTKPLTWQGKIQGEVTTVFKLASQK